MIGRPFVKGQSGNPSGRPKGGASIAATLRGLLSRPDAEAICKRLIDQAKAGELAAVRILLDRIDAPLTGPIAVAMAQAGVVQSPFHDGPAPNVQVTIVDNHRDDPELTKAQLRDVISRLAPMPEAEPEALPAQPEQAAPLAPPATTTTATTTTPLAEPPSEPEAEQEPEPPPGVMTGEQFLMSS